MPGRRPEDSLSPERNRRSAALPAAPKVAPLVPRRENLMTKRLLVTAVVSLGATALTFAPSTHLAGLAGVAPARAATAAATVPADADSGMDDSAVGALDRAGLGGPVDAAGAAAADGPIDADAHAAESCSYCRNSAPTRNLPRVVRRGDHNSGNDMHITPGPRLKPASLLQHGMPPDVAYGSMSGHPDRCNS